MQDRYPTPCACTGVRWCAHCRDPEQRRVRKMDDPVPLPRLLAADRIETAEPDIHLFDLEPGYAPTCPEFCGLLVLRDFVTPAEEIELLEQIEASPFQPSQSGKEKQHFGPKVNFNKRRIKLGAFRGIPDYGREIEAKMRRRLASRVEQDVALRHALQQYETTDVFVLRYHPERRSNLDFHLDDTFAYGELILDLSLESDAALTFYRGRPKSEVEDPAARNAPEACVRVPLPARALAVLFGEARYGWEHALLSTDVRARRTSITLRTLSPALRRSEGGREVILRARAPEGMPGTREPERP